MKNKVNFLVNKHSVKDLDYSYNLVILEKIGGNVIFSNCTGDPEEYIEDTFGLSTNMVDYMFTDNKNIHINIQ